MTSICTVTMERADLTIRCLTHALSHTGSPYEFLSVDNGSTDERVVRHVATLAPVYHRRNSENLGYAAMLNQMLLRARGEYLCVLDPDLSMPNDWLWKLVDANQAIPESGLCGVHCVQSLPAVQTLHDKKVHPAREVFGAKFISRRVLETVGYFYEGYGLYGHEDVDYNYRTQKMGLTNYYVADMCAVHEGEDSSHNSEYRKQKWEALKLADLVWAKRFEYMEASRDFYVPPPALSD